MAPLPCTRAAVAAGRAMPSQSPTSCRTSNDDGLLPDGQWLVRDAIAAAAASQKTTNPPTPAVPAAPRLRDMSDACPVTGNLGEEGEARVRANNKEENPSRNMVVLISFAALSFFRAYVLYTRETARGATIVLGAFHAATLVFLFTTPLPFLGRR